MSGERILIVEDEYISAVAIRNALEDLGYIVAGTAISGEQALVKAKDTNPNLVLMDITLDGDMNGIETAERIINELEIMVIFISAHTDNNTFTHASKIKYFDYIIKPFTGKELGESLEKAFSRVKDRD